MNEFKLSGKICYDGRWAWLSCPEDVGVYYRACAKRVWGVTLSSPLNGPHITLVAGKYESPARPELWGALEGKRLDFTYTGLVHVADYWWLKIGEDSNLRKFRTDLGLSEELKYAFHLTVGKDQNYVGKLCRDFVPGEAKV